MKTTKNLTSETYENDRIYILWDNVEDEDGQIIDPAAEVDAFANEILSDSNFQQMESDKAVASHYGFDNCIICGIDEE